MAANASTRLMATAVGAGHLTAANIVNWMTLAGATRANMAVLARTFTAGVLPPAGAITANALTVFLA